MDICLYQQLTPTQLLKRLHKINIETPTIELIPSPGWTEPWLCLDGHAIEDHEAYDLFSGIMVRQLTKWVKDPYHKLQEFNLNYGLDQHWRCTVTIDGKNNMYISPTDNEVGVLLCCCAEIKGK